MRKINLKIIGLTLILSLSISIGTAANKKLAQTGFQFLSVVTDARAAAMGGAMTTIHGYSNSLFCNPAGMARIKNLFDLHVSQNSWIADIDYNAFSCSLVPSRGKYGVFGLSLISVNYGELQGTEVWPNEDGYIDTELFTPTALVVGGGYAKALSDKFSVGGQIKSAYQFLGTSVLPDSVNVKGEVITKEIVKNYANAVAFDFGTIFLTGWNSLAFGMSIRNFSEEIKYQSEGFQLPLTFRIGISMNVMQLLPSSPIRQSLIVSIDALHPRSYPERLNIGFEYILMEVLALRGGYLYNYDERNVTAGFGIQKQIRNIFVGVDYAYTPFGIFDEVQRFSLQFAF